MEEIKKEIVELKKEIEKFRKLVTDDLTKSIEGSVERKLGEVLISIISTLNNELIHEKISTSCSRYAKCTETFSRLLNDALRNGVELRAESNEFEILYKEKARILSQLEENAPYENCLTCFSETLELLKRQEKMLKLFKNTLKRSFHPNIEYTDVDANDVLNKLEPISNLIRIKILIELSKHPRRFSQLSKVTGLDGGNLRFHLRRLADAGLIIQHKKGGEYMITETGKIFFDRLINLLNSI